MKKNSRKNKKKKIKFLGFKISEDTLVAIVAVTIGAIISIVGLIRRDYKLTNGETRMVTARITEVGTRRKGGRGWGETGYIKCEYFINKKKYSRSLTSLYVRDNIEQYRIGECILLLVSLEDESVYDWDDKKGSFKCD